MSTAARNPASFVFTAAKADGGRTLGVRQAASERALADVLRKERLLLLRSYRLPAWATKTEGLLGLKERAELNDQLAQLLSRGVPLVEALEVTAATVHPSARAKVEKMRELVAAGSGFADACAKTGSFDPVTIAVYRAAERTGDLAGAAAQLARTARRQLAVKGKAATLAVYPAIVLSISILVATLMLTVIVPRIGEALTQMDKPLPWYTHAVMGLGAFMRAHALVLLGAVVVGITGLVIWRQRVGTGLAAAARRLPAVKRVLLAQELTRFFSVMAAMTRSGVPLADALGVANGAINDPALRAQLVSLRNRLIEGGSLRLLIEGVDALPLATRRLLIAAERAGDLETAFDSLAADMADEVDRRATRLLAALEPALIVGMFLMIGSLVLSIMIPLITLSQGVM